MTGPSLRIESSYNGSSALLFLQTFHQKFQFCRCPLRILTSSQIHFLWNAAAKAAFKSSKEKFTSAPVLSIPDPKLQFIVEVNNRGGHQNSPVQEVTP